MDSMTTKDDGRENNDRLGQEDEQGPNWSNKIITFYDISEELGA